MGEVASRLLRNDTRGVLRRVQQGESVTITVDGLPVARLEPVASRSRWIARTAFINRILSTQADAALSEDLKLIAPDTTDSLPL